MSNPYAYYDDEPLPLGTKTLSVSSDGDEEPDREPRGPLELDGYFIVAFLPAVKTYHITATKDALECRLPGGAFLELTRDEAAECVSVHGNEIDIVLPDRSHCFRCKPQKNLLLTLARLKVWLQTPITDPEEAYKAVAVELQKNLGKRFYILIAVFVFWQMITCMGDYSYLLFGSAGLEWPISSLYFGVSLLKMACILAFSAFLLLRYYGRLNMAILRAGVFLALILFAATLIPFFIPGITPGNLRHAFVFIDIWFPIILYTYYHNYRHAEKQLQRDNGLR